ncbi:hypothetical protein CVS48_14790 [Achromobacter spanius]|nr:hypothetical protein CVS48_14790 [Achromobacter spanius]
MHDAASQMVAVPYQVQVVDQFAAARQLDIAHQALCGLKWPVAMAGGINENSPPQCNAPVRGCHYARPSKF